MTATMKDVSLTKLAVRAAGLERKEPQRYAAGAPASTPVSNASISSSVAFEPLAQHREVASRVDKHRDRSFLSLLTSIAATLIMLGAVLAHMPRPWRAQYPSIQRRESRPACILVSLDGTPGQK